MNTKLSLFLPSLLLGVIASGLVTILRSTQGIIDFIYFLNLLFITFFLSVPIEAAVRKMIKSVKENKYMILWFIITLLSPIPLLFFTLIALNATG